MSATIAFLLILVLQVLCVPPRCQEVNVDTEEVRGQCCLFVKNEFEMHEREKIVQRFLDSVNKGSNANRRVSGVHKLMYPDDEIRQRKPSEENLHNHKNKKHPGDEVTANRKTVDSKENETKNITLGTRVNVDVPDTCTKGYRKIANGDCVEIFDDIN